MRRTVLITGAASGLGNACARLFANNDWNVAAGMRDPRCAHGLGDGDTLASMSMNVTDPVSVQRAVDSTIQCFGRIDVVVNNAGYGHWGAFESLSDDEIRKQFDVNVFGLMTVTRAVLPHFRALRAGTLVNISSAAGVVASPLASAYVATKFAVEGFSESLAHELNPLGITVRIVEPGAMWDTKFLDRAMKTVSAVRCPSEYVHIVQSMQRRVASSPKAAAACASTVAQQVYRAATEQGSQLRYSDFKDVSEILRLRRETSEEQYMTAMRRSFAVRE